MRRTVETAGERHCVTRLSGWRVLCSLALAGKERVDWALIGQLSAPCDRSSMLTKSTPRKTEFGKRKIVLKNPYQKYCLILTNSEIKWIFFYCSKWYQTIIIIHVTLVFVPVALIFYFLIATQSVRKDSEQSWTVCECKEHMRWIISLILHIVKTFTNYRQWVFFVQVVWTIPAESRLKPSELLFSSWNINLLINRRKQVKSDKVRVLHWRWISTMQFFMGARHTWQLDNGSLGGDDRKDR